MEVRNIELKHLDFDQKILHIVQSKAKKDRFFPLSDHLIRVIKTYISVEHRTNFLFTVKTKAPSGLQPQFTAMYFLVDDKYKSYNISAGITSGYLFDFNKEFNNQFRVSPYVYMETFPFNIKVGHEYVMPLNQGQFFVSIGIGGGYLFRHFSIM